MKNIIILCASVLGVVQGVDTQGEKTLLVGVRPHQLAKRDWYAKLAPNTQSWVLSDSYIGQNDDEERCDFAMGVVNFAGKKVGFNGVTDDDLDHAFSDVYDQKPLSEKIRTSLMDLDQRTTLPSGYKASICKEGINHDQIVNWSKNLQSAISDAQTKPMTMYGMPFVDKGDLTEEGKKHRSEFDTVIVDQSVFKFLAGLVSDGKAIDRAEIIDKAEMVKKTTKALSELVYVGGELIILNPGGNLTHTESLKGQKCYDYLRGRGLSHDVANKYRDVGFCRHTDDLDPSVEKAFSSLKGIVFDDVSIGKDTFSGHGGPMIHFRNKKKDIPG